MKYCDIITQIKNSNKDELAINIFKLSLSSQSLLIFNCLKYGIENAIDCKEISVNTGISTKNISSILGEIENKYQGIKTIKTKRKHRYYL